MKLDHENLIKLIEGCAKNDRICQQQIFKLYYGKMMAICLRYGKNSEDAKDILQDGFIKMFKNIHSYGGNGSFEGWVRRIITNSAIDAVRRYKSDKMVVDSEIVNNLEAADEPEDDEMVVKGVSPQMIVEEIKNLSPQYRLVFNMYIMEGLTHREIANELGISEGTSKSNLAKAKKKVRQSLLVKVSLVNE